MRITFSEAFLVLLMIVITTEIAMVFRLIPKMEKKAAEQRAIEDKPFVDSLSNLFETFFGE